MQDQVNGTIHNQSQCVTNRLTIGKEIINSVWLLLNIHQGGNDNAILPKLYLQMEINTLIFKHRLIVMGLEGSLRLG
jgi:hypothetical protein